MGTSHSSRREVQLGTVFVALADTLVTGFDLSDLLQTLIEETTALMPVEAAALFLADPDGVLKVAAATSSDAKAVEVVILEAEASPCLEAYVSGRQSGANDVDDVKPEWTEYADIMRAAGYRSSHAIPMRLRDETIGVLSLFSEYRYTPSELDAAVAQALADAATISIIQMHVISDNKVLAEQLQHALDSRVLIEQAKGVLSHTRSVSVDEAFDIIRDHARRTGDTLMNVARAITDRSLTL
jgi:GAF domain-containing protein